MSDKKISCAFVALAFLGLVALYIADSAAATVEADAIIPETPAEARHSSVLMSRDPLEPIHPIEVGRLKAYSALELDIERSISRTMNFQHGALALKKLNKKIRSLIKLCKVKPDCKVWLTREKMIRKEDERFFRKTNTQRSRHHKKGKKIKTHKKSSKGAKLKAMRAKLTKYKVAKKAAKKKKKGGKKKSKKGKNGKRKSKKGKPVGNKKKATKKNNKKVAQKKKAAKKASKKKGSKKGKPAAKKKKGGKKSTIKKRKKANKKNGRKKPVFTKTGKVKSQRKTAAKKKMAAA